MLVINPVSKEAADRLATKIMTYWRERKYTSVVAVPVRTSVLGHGEVWVVRSNLIKGLPPRTQ